MAVSPSFYNFRAVVQQPATAMEQYPDALKMETTRAGRLNSKQKLFLELMETMPESERRRFARLREEYQ